MKDIAEQTSNAYYECAKVNAIVKAGKIDAGAGKEH